MAFDFITGLGNGCNHDDEDKLNNVISDTIIGCKSSLHLVNDSVDFVSFEILSRLPVKSLVGFKCVCKHWQFLIEKDLHFIDLHKTRSKPCLLILVPKQIIESFHIINPSYREFLITANLLFEGSSNNAVSVADVHTIREFDRTIFDILLGPVNGLIGFFDLTLYNGVCIANISTREITPWIKSTVASELEGPAYHHCVYRDANCNMGFDPVTKEHKVICIWDIIHYNDQCEEMVCEVLTVGDNKWRRIVETPPYTCSKASVHVNGSIYYFTLAFMCRLREDNNNKIVVFDVDTEKFRTITVPNFIIEHPRDNDQFIPSSYYVLHEGVHYELLEVDDHIALFSRINGYIVKLWLFDDNVDCNSNDTSNQNWTEVTIELPYFWGADRSLSLHSIVGTDQIILISLQKSCGKKYSRSLHSYNWRDKIFKEFEISAIPSVVQSFSYRGYVTTFMESLLHVKKPTTQQFAMPKQQTGATTVRRKPVFVKIDQLKPGTYGHTLIAKVVTANPVWEKAKRIVECLIGDETGSILFTARNEQVDIMKPGNTVIIRNAKIVMFKGSMRLAVDKWGHIEVTDPADFAVNEDNNLSHFLSA